MANYGITEFIGNMQLFIEQLTVFFYQKNQKAMSSQTFSVLLIPRAICRRIFIQGDLEFLQMCHTTYMYPTAGGNVFCVSQCHTNSHGRHGVPTVPW